jgi:hypothetical protein
MNTDNLIIENNRLIAEFMGYEPILSWEQEFDGVNPDSILKYNSSWDWLIPVVNKIYHMDSYYKYKEETSGQFVKDDLINTKFITDTYENVIEFIKWYKGQEVH